MTGDMNETITVWHLLWNVAGTGLITIVVAKWLLGRVTSTVDAYAGERAKLTARFDKP